MTLHPRIQKACWDGEWFIWAIGDDGTVYGTKDYEEGQVYLNTQVWWVISEAATPEQAQKAMQTVKDRLATPYGLALSAPPFVKTPFDVMRAVFFLNGIKENAGIFNHTQGWGVMAECILGNGDCAYEYYRAFMPAAYNDRAEIRQSEPYVQAQTNLLNRFTACGQYAHLVALWCRGVGILQRYAIHSGDSSRNEWTA